MLRKSPQIIAEEYFVERAIGSLPSICEKCRATLAAYATNCTAELSDACPGFLMIEEVRRKFQRECRG